MKAPDLAVDGVYRLVVQSYASPHGVVPDQTARPLGSTQRVATADELRNGVYVNLLELARAADPQDKPVVVAWIEAGAPDLEFDGRTARPGPGSVFGSVKRQGDRDVQISLKRKLVG